MKTLTELRNFLVDEFRHIYKELNKSSCGISNDKEVVKMIAGIINEIKQGSGNDISYGENF